MQFTDLILLFVIACSTAYAMSFMILERNNSEVVLFQVKDVKVQFDAYEDANGMIIAPHRQFAGLQDRIRLFFGAYKVHQNQWIVGARGDVWQCPVCLSFWMAIAGTIMFLALVPVSSIMLIPFIHVAHAAMSVVIYHRMDY